jgi:hypothetical protein
MRGGKYIFIILRSKLNLFPSDGNFSAMNNKPIKVSYILTVSLLLLLLSQPRPSLSALAGPSGEAGQPGLAGGEQGQPTDGRNANGGESG